LFTGSIHEIDARITIYQHCLSLPSCQSHPDRPVVVLGLAAERFERHWLSNQWEDLDKSILHCTESILYPPRSWLKHGPIIHETLLLLASALLKRSTLSHQPEDVIYATKYLRHLRDQPHQVFGFAHRVTSLLVDTLCFQALLDVGNVNIGELAVLCCELLTLDLPDFDATHSITHFADVALCKIDINDLDQPLDQVIDCLRAVRKHKPNLRKARLALAQSLASRYYMTLVNEDYEDAASALDEFITSSSPGDSEDDVAQAQESVTYLATTRSMTHETPEYLEEAMYRTRAFLASSSAKKLCHPAFELESTAKGRFGYFGPIAGLEDLSGNSLSSQPVPDDSELGRILKTMDLFDDILSGIRNNDITIIDEAVESGRTALTSVDSRHPLMSLLLENFGKILDKAFIHTNKIEYLDESITARRQVFDRPLSLFKRFETRHRLSLSFLMRYVSFPGHSTQDLDEGLELLSQYVNDGQVSLPDRFEMACVWASVARDARHPSTSTAYESAVSLMQDTVPFAPTLQLQHVTLATSEKSHRLPLDYASYQVGLHQLEETIEILERGRALLWSEMRHLRASIDQLMQVDPQLAHKFAAVSRDLEELTKSIPPSHKLSVDDGAADDLRAVDSFGRLLLKQRSLLKEHDSLISQIQALPGFDSFLKPPSFDTLRSVASCGPVIIINHSRWRSDILILLHNASPSLIPTSYDFYHRASALKDKLSDSRHKYGLDSSYYEETLASVLAELYNLVGKPVIDRLRQMKVPEQSRIWWCPTSVFCSLPLHAMGPIPSDQGEMRYFLDLYICSYTPSLSVLIQSRNRDFGSRPSDRPSLLLVAQPDPSLPTVGGEIQVVQALDTEVTSLISEAATPATVVDGFRHHRFVHFACHGTLEDDKPFEAGFELHGGERLTLLEIVRSHLPTAEFAFLSACHTAEVTEGSAADEVLHLAAAVQYCGFRSVVGTMWAMVDEDGQDLAKHFYKALFSTSRREEGVPYHERSAKALRFAVKKLRGTRKRRITLERWVNFVHYGA
jgi:CHAT domain-containing protein